MMLMKTSVNDRISGESRSILLTHPWRTLDRAYDQPKVLNAYHLADSGTFQMTFAIISIADSDAQGSSH